MSKQSGFTLIELLTVIAIIGLLAAIGIPQFLSYRVNGFDSRARSDLRNSIVAQEANYLGSGSYVACTNAGCNDPVLPTFQISTGISMNHVPSGGGADYSAEAWHVSGAHRFDYTNGAFTSTP
jgi:prepilin-type N-terminal cleavage/methylation domain-containing protein